MPIMSAPSMFIINVFIGNESGFFIGMRPIKYLKTAPIKPPSPTITQFSSVLLSVLFD